MPAETSPDRGRQLGAPTSTASRSRSPRPATGGANAWGDEDGSPRARLAPPRPSSSPPPPTARAASPEATINPKHPPGLRGSAASDAWLAGRPREDATPSPSSTTRAARARWRPGPRHLGEGAARFVVSRREQPAVLQRAYTEKMTAIRNTSMQGTATSRSSTFDHP